MKLQTIKEYKESQGRLTIPEVAERFNMGVNTIGDHIRKGSKILVWDKYHVLIPIKYIHHVES